MTADVVTMRPEEKAAEADAIAARRADAIAWHPSVRGGCPPHAALLHELARFITSEDLPPALLRIDGPHVHVDATGFELVENTVRRYAAAIGADVKEEPFDDDGFAATRWTAEGMDDGGLAWEITGSLLLPIDPPHDGFGVGLVNG